MATLSQRDQDILRAEVADKIEQLLPMTSLPGWRGVFESQVSYWRVKANSTPSNSDERSEYNGWSLAHKFVLDEVQS